MNPWMLYDCNATAIFSPDRVYRYLLWRSWQPEHSDPGYLLVIGLNPSTADEREDDPTIRKCRALASNWGLNGLCMANLFAYRSTDPDGMKAVPEPCGIANLSHIRQAAHKAARILVAWGKHGTHRHQDRITLTFLWMNGHRFECLKKNKDGTPIHPLYQPNDSLPIPYEFEPTYPCKNERPL